MKEFIKKHIGIKTYNYYMNIIDYNSYRRSNPQEAEILKANKKFKGKYQGKRCFILGNGPSLKEVDFDKLANEYVFTVNNIMRVDGYEKLHTNFHLWMDLAYFNLRNDLKYNISEVKKEINIMAGMDGVECFARIEGRPFMNRICKRKNINYLKAGIELFDEFDMEADFTKYVPTFTTVVQYAILLAVYMGFKEIYLLGCDSTSVKSMIDLCLNEQIESFHAYSIEKDDAKHQLNQIKINWEMDKYLYDQYRLFLGYRVLNTYCRRRKVKLINLTSSTLIDTIPKMDITEVLS